MVKYVLKYQKVKLGIPEQALLNASALVYMLPLFVLVITALAAQALLPQLGLDHEGYVVLTTFVATALSFWRVKAYVKQDNGHQYQPRLLELLPSDADSIPINIKH